MKRILFSLLAGLVSLPLAGCTLSLLATPTPSPTPLAAPVPNTLENEIGTPTDVLQFSGSSDSLRPMMEAVTSQLGFTPAEGELAGFTVKGTMGEGSYFFVSHDGAVYTIFAHADGGYFETVKVDGPNKTSDFAIFKMMSINRDPSTEWWGMNDGKGSMILPPMFVFTLNNNGSVKSVAFVEPKSGNSIQVSESTTQISFERKALFEPRVPLGGDEVAYMYDGARLPMPEGVKALLTPSSPDTWNQTGWYFTDGTPYPWGEPIVAGSEKLLVVIPSFVRGVVEIPEPQANVGGKVLFVVLEVPAQGGSNFIIVNFQDNKFATYATFGINYLVNGKVPLNWAQSSWENPMNNADFVAGNTFTGLYNGRQIADEFYKHIGQMVMVAFRPTAGTNTSFSLRQVVEGTLINQNGQSGVDSVNPLVGLTLQKLSP